MSIRNDIATEFHKLESWLEARIHPDDISEAREKLADTHQKVADMAAAAQAPTGTGQAINTASGAAMEAAKTEGVDDKADSINDLAKQRDDDAPQS